MARLNSARSRVFSWISSKILIAQTSLGLSGGFWPVSLHLRLVECVSSDCRRIADRETPFHTLRTLYSSTSGCYFTIEI